MSTGSAGGSCTGPCHALGRGLLSGPFPSSGPLSSKPLFCKTGPQPFSAPGHAWPGPTGVRGSGPADAELQEEGGGSGARWADEVPRPRPSVPNRHPPQSSATRHSNGGAQPGEKGKGGAPNGLECVMGIWPRRCALKKAPEQGQGAGSHGAQDTKGSVPLCSQGSLGTTVGNHLQASSRGRTGTYGKTALSL